jgi:hypothetical protein
VPLRRANSVIVYLGKDVFDEVVRQAEALDRSRSYVCQDLIKEALAWRKGDALDGNRLVAAANAFRDLWLRQPWVPEDPQAADAWERLRVALYGLADPNP